MYRVVSLWTAVKYKHFISIKYDEKNLPFRIVNFHIITHPVVYYPHKSSDHCSNYKSSLFEEFFGKITDSEIRWIGILTQFLLNINIDFWISFRAFPVPALLPLQLWWLRLPTWLTEGNRNRRCRSRTPWGSSSHPSPTAAFCARSIDWFTAVAISHFLRPCPRPISSSLSSFLSLQLLQSEPLWEFRPHIQSRLCGTFSLDRG